MYKAPMDNDNGERQESSMWEVGVGRAGESNGGEMETIVTAQQ